LRPGTAASGQRPAATERPAARSDIYYPGLGFLVSCFLFLVFCLLFFVFLFFVAGRWFGSGWPLAAGRWLPTGSGWPLATDR